jgi:outer membrane autotransporter protein
MMMAVFVKALPCAVSTGGCYRFRALAGSALCGSAVLAVALQVSAARADQNLSPSFTNQNDDQTFITILQPINDPGDLTAKMKRGNDTMRFGVSLNEQMDATFGGTATIDGGSGTDTFINTEFSSVTVGGLTSFTGVERFQNDGKFNAQGGFEFLGTGGGNTLSYGGSGLLDITDGDLTVATGGGDDSFTIDAGSRITIRKGSGNFDGGSGTDSFTNAGKLTFGGLGTSFSNFETTTNAGTMRFNNGTAGDVLSVEGDFTNSGVLDMHQENKPSDVLGDRIEIGGTFNSSSGSTIELDAQVTAGGKADVVEAGTANGTTTLDVTFVNNNGPRVLIDNPVYLVKSDNVGDLVANIIANGKDLGAIGGGINLSENLDGFDTGLVDYWILNNGGNVTIQSQLNDAKAGGVAQGFASTISSISAIFQKPITAFVSRCKPSDSDGHGFGTWARGSTGEISTSASGVSSFQNNRLSTKNETDYAGFQGGLDGAACDTGDGNTYHAGLLFGTISGTSEQVQSVDRLTADFNTQFIGAYATWINNGGFAADATLRYDYHTFDLSHTDPSMVPDDDVNGDTISAAVGAGYTIVVGEGMSIRPALGLLVGSTAIDSFTSVSVDEYIYKDQLSIMGSASLSAQKLFNLNDSANLLVFVNGTVFNEFGDKPEATFIIKGTPITNSMSNIGTFGQVGAGITLLAAGGEAPTAPDLVGTLRVDAQIGDKIEGWGITAQARLQF